MARIELPPGDADELMRLWSMNTDLARAAVGFSSAVYASDLIPVRTRELMRMRIAQINQCEVCLETRLEDPSAAGIDEVDYEHVAQWATWPGYSAAERVAIDLAEKVAVDHMALDDAWFAVARAHFTDQQLHGMVVMVGSWIALGRVQAVFDVHTSCPIRL
jgi:AhpD family alkylhydroperoxidase